MSIWGIWVLKKNGALLVKRDYGLGTNMDSALFSGFISAMLTFSKELTSSELDSINMGKYQVRISCKESIIFCLIHDRDENKDYITQVVHELQKRFFDFYSLEFLNGDLLDLSVLTPFGEVIDEVVESTPIPSSSLEGYNLEEIQNILGALTSGQLSPQNGVKLMLNQLKNVEAVEQVLQTISNTSLLAQKNPNSAFTRFLERLSAEVAVWGRPVKFFICGLSKAGKTAIMQRFHGSIDIKTVPTTGLSLRQVTQDNIMINTWDASGQRSFRESWVMLAEKSDGVIYVIDATDKDGLEEARREFYRFLQHSDTQHVPLAILANKKDLPGFIGGRLILSYFHLDELVDRDFKVFETSAFSGEGIKEAFSWLISRIIEKWKRSAFPKFSVVKI